MLALRANRTVSTDELIDGLWADHPPASAAKNVQLHISRLRKALASDDCPASIVTHGRGYELQLSEDAVDAVRFEQLVERARRDADQGSADGAARGALELWRGAPLADVASEPFAESEIRRLEELYLRALELSVDAELEAGRHGEVIAQLEALLAEHPLNERFYAQRMLALYRAGRQSEALEAYRQARATLSEEIGIEPGHELRRLQEQILAQDRALDAPTQPEELPPQLEGGSPLLAGRERELGWLRERWQEARAGGVVCAMVWGPAGIGKTRLVAELAAEVQRAGAAVLFAGGGEVLEAALASVAEAREAYGPTLLVIDYADDVPRAVLDAAAALAREPEGRALLICVLHHDEPGPPAFAALLERGAAQRLRLDPLRDDATAEIAALYAPEQGVTMPLRTLIAESDGVPLRVHRVADEWARAEAAERLVATAGRAMGERPGLRTTEAELTGSVVDLQVARERKAFYTHDEPPGASEPLVCPFRGLAPFDAAHAEYFFGRERLVAELVARLVGSTLLAVVGPSGSGKSSAVRAGLLPALASGVVPGSDGWRQAVMRPGERPLAELSRTLARAVPEAGGEEPRNASPIAAALDCLAAGERQVVCVDQFEEVFFACRNESEREAFLDALVEGAADTDERLVVVLAIRADFYGRCAEHAELATLIGANQVLVGPMRRDELRRAIELPARKAGLRVEPRLVSALTGDVAGEPGGLPLLSAAMLELWQRRDGRTLRYSDYERSGGVSGAVARLAEAAYRRLGPAERRRARPMLLRLAGAEESAEALVRRRVSVDELELERDPDAARALAVLTESRLLTVDEGTVEVAHEALLREWPRLRSWLEADAEGRRLHQHLIGAAAEWRDSGRDPAELYRGARLAAALDWASEHDPELNELEREFLEESRAVSERQAERQRRTNRRLRTLLAGVGVLLAAAVVAGVIAISERQGARNAATAEAAQRLGAQAVTDDDLDQALRIANTGVALDDSVATRSSLFSVLLRSPAALGSLYAGGGTLFSLALSPDGATLALGDNDGTVTLYDTGTRERIGEYEAAGGVPWLGFGPRDGSLTVVTKHPDGSRAYVHIIDAATQRQRGSFPLGRNPADPGSLYIPVATYAPDGRSLIVGYWGDGLLVLRRFDPGSGSQLGGTLRVGRGSLSHPRTTPDGRVIWTGNHATYVIDPQTLRVVRRYPVGGRTLDIDADDGTLAIGTGNGVRLLDLGSGQVRSLKGPGHAASGVFSPDGRTLTSTAPGGLVIIWDLREGRPIEILDGPRGPAWSQAFSPDGRTLYTAADDGTARIWDVAGDRRLGRAFRTNALDETRESPPPFAVSPGGRTLAVARFDGRVDLIDAETLRRTSGFEAFADRSGLAIEYSPDGRRLAVAGVGGGVGLWNARSGQRIGPLLSVPRGPQLKNGHNLRALAFGRGGLLAAVGVGGALRTWNLDGREPVARSLQRRRGLSGEAVLPGSIGLAFSPDGSQLAIPVSVRFRDEEPDGVDVRDPRSGERLARLRSDSQVRSVAFSPDGRLLAGGQVDGSTVVWATHPWRKVGQPLTLGFGEHQTLGVAFSPDGRTLAASYDDGAVALWDVGSQRPIGSPLPGLPDAWTAARFAPDGDRLFALSATGRALRWELDPEAWVQKACAVAGDLTPEVWEEVVPEQDYVSVCPSG
jgi:WD40 repeat protein/DNA-binding SARP family transcriptional activator